jgi:hypothetical protein
MHTIPEPALPLFVRRPVSLFHRLLRNAAILADSVVPRPVFLAGEVNQGSNIVDDDDIISFSVRTATSSLRFS